MHWPAIPGTRFRAGFVYNMGDEEARSLVVLVVCTEIKYVHYVVVVRQTDRPKVLVQSFYV